MAIGSRTGRPALLAMTIGLLPASIMLPVAFAQATAPAADTAAATKPGIRVAPVIMAEPEVETSISIQVGPETAIPRQTYLRIRGMPLAARLSEGHVVTPGIWAIPLAALPSLRLMAPLSSSGRTDIYLSLVSVDGGVLAETKSSLVVAPAWLLGAARPDGARAVPSLRIDASRSSPEPDAPKPTTAESAVPPVPTPAPAVVVPPPQAVARVEAPAVAPQPAPPARAPPALAPPAPAVVAALPPAPASAPAPRPPEPPAVKAPPAVPQAAPVPPPTAPQAAPAPTGPPVLAPADRERAEGMVQRGDTYLKQGNLAAARQFFRRAADMGLAAGALRMGATYDPSELAGMALVGIQADAKEATQWYERARELGAPEAVSRLSRLPKR